MFKIFWLGIFILSLHLTPALTSYYDYGYTSNIQPTNKYPINIIVNYKDVPAGTYKYKIIFNHSHWKSIFKEGIIDGTKSSFPIETKLASDVIVNVEIYNVYNEICHTNVIDTNYVPPKDQYDQGLINKYYYFPINCTKDDFKIHCDRSENNYYCHSDKTTLITRSYMHWYQYYDDETIIGNASLSDVTETNYMFTLEDFDNNSFLSSKLTNDTKNNNVSKVYYKSNVHLISYPVDKRQNLKVKKQEYSESHLFVFSCLEYRDQYTNVQVALINASKNRLKPLGLDAVNMTIAGIEPNGSILCCLMFEVRKQKTVGYITRKIEKKTLLVYKPIENEMLFSLYPIIIIPLFIVLIAPFIGIMMYKKLRKKSESPPTLELDTYANPDRLLYAELNVNQENPQIPNQVESPYAEIAGVLKAKKVHLFH